MSVSTDLNDSGWQPDTTETSPTAAPSAMPQRIAAPTVPIAENPEAEAGELDRELDLDDSDVTPHDLHKQRRLRREAQALRERAKSAEAEVESMRGVLDGLRRGEVERLAASALHDTRDLLDRHDVAYFLDEAGNVDPGRVSAAIDTLVADRPHIAAPPVVTTPPTNRPLEGLHAGASPQRQPEPTTWQSALRPLVQ